MLVLSARAGNTIKLEGLGTLVVTKMEGDQVFLGFDFPGVNIVRGNVKGKPRQQDVNRSWQNARRERR